MKQLRTGGRAWRDTRRVESQRESRGDQRARRPAKSGRRGAAGGAASWTDDVNGDDLVVNITGVDDLFLELAPALLAFANPRVQASWPWRAAAVGQRIRSSGLAVTVRPRRDARAALANARVVMHMSDGARFPSFAIAAHSAGVPTIARATEINRELLEGAAALVANDQEVRRRARRGLDQRVATVDHGRGRAVERRRFRAGHRGARLPLALSRGRARLVVVKRTIAISSRTALPSATRRDRHVRPWTRDWLGSDSPIESLDVVGFAPRRRPRADGVPLRVGPRAVRRRVSRPSLADRATWACRR